MEKKAERIRKENKNWAVLKEKKDEKLGSRIRRNFWRINNQDNDYLTQHKYYFASSHSLFY